MTIRRIWMVMLVPFELLSSYLRCRGSVRRSFNSAVEEALTA